MSQLITPPLNATGIYQLREPWVAKPTHTYSCIAIRRFDEMLIEHEDIYNDHYRPKGLVPGIYESDLQAGASLVTLISNKGEVIDVPDSFIVSFPDMNLSEYTRVIVSLDLGALPPFFDVTHLRTKVQELAKGVIGREPVVNTHAAPLRNPLKKESADQAETVRQNAITDKQTTQMTLTNWEKQRADLNLAVTRLTNYSKKLENDLDEARRGSTEQVQQLQRDLNEKSTQITQLTQEKRGLISTHEQTVRELKQSHQTEINKLNQIHQETERELKEEIKRLKEQATTQLLPDEIKNANLLKEQLTRKRDEYHLSGVSL